MNRYDIQFDTGRATLYCRTFDEGEAIAAFRLCASESPLGHVGKIISVEMLRDQEMPVPYCHVPNVTHLLTYSKGIVAFDRNHTHEGRGWKVVEKFEQWCRCADRPAISESCPVHGPF